MEYSFNKFVHHIKIQDEIVILDELNNRYFVLNECQTEDLINLISDGSASSATAIELITLEVISHVNSGPCKLRCSSPEQRGVDNLQWNSRWGSNNPRTFKVMCSALFFLVFVKFELSVFGFHRVLQSMRQRKRKIRGDSLVNSDAFVKEFASSLYAVSVYLPFKVKCLEFSVALFLYLAQKNVDSTFKIGVQRYDFLSHAWVEIGGSVVADNPALCVQMPIILEL